MFFFFLLTVFAVWQAVELWRHGSIFAKARAWADVQSIFTSTLLGCMFCLSNWVAGILTTLALLAFCIIENGSWYVFALWPLWTLASARLANVLNDITHTIGRTPKENLTWTSVDSAASYKDLLKLTEVKGEESE